MSRRRPEWHRHTVGILLALAIVAAALGSLVLGL
jgi:hypothetical protein